MSSTRSPDPDSAIDSNTEKQRRKLESAIDELARAVSDKVKPADSEQQQTEEPEQSERSVGADAETDSRR